MKISRAAMATALCAGFLVTVALTTGHAQPAAPGKVPVRGVAEVGVLAPVTNVDQKASEVVTVIKVKNLANGPIVGLKVEEFWWDKASNPVTGSSDRLKKPLLPGEVATFTLKTPKDPKMFRNSYQFSHQNGTVKTKPLTKKEIG